MTGQSDPETALISLFFFALIFNYMGRVRIMSCEVYLVRSFLRLIWLSTMILLTYTLGEIRWIGEEREGDYYEEEGAWIILTTILLIILLSLGSINHMVETQPFLPY